MHNTKTARYYRPELDALRLLAFLSVFTVHRMDHLPIDSVRHFWLYNICLLGNFGVPVFFLLSAFLITELLLREDDRLGTIHIGSFYIRRILRIWPLYFAVFYGLVLLTQFVPWTGPTDPRSWLAFTLLAGNWYICLHGWIPAFPVNPMWGLSVEEQFYIAIPLIALFGRRFGLRTASLTLIAVSYATVTWYAWKGWHGFSSQWTNSFVQFQFFAAGTLLSIALKGRQLVRLCEYLHLAEWTGEVGTVIALCATILVAHLSYQFYEPPFLRLKQRFTFIPPRDDVSLGEWTRQEACVQ